MVHPWSFVLDVTRNSRSAPLVGAPTTVRTEATA
jgi:hypothetical protein